MTIDPLLGPPLARPTATTERIQERWQRLGETLADPELAAFVAASASDASLAPLLEGIFAGSPFLSECLLAEPDILRGFAQVGPEPVAQRLQEATATAGTGDRARLMAELRRLRRRHALVVGLADLAGRWDLDHVTRALTAFADAAIGRAVEHLIAEAIGRGELASGEQADPARSSGLVVLGMGKLGAFELNYSSDIDLIVLFDEQRIPYRGAEAPMAFAVRAARALGHILEHRTREGYVFRTDLRLRPHLPGHPLAISTDAAELYYERHGQNWERAAFIKARPVGGDLEAGQSFLDRLRPYVWRRHLDYAAIRDIHSIKRQINAHRGFGQIRLLGHDLKVGRGGIREIEFFVQVQQLILGGREPGLRATGTRDALAALASGRWVEAAAAQELDAAYRLLRALEHRLQMVADKQTQTLPALEDELAGFAAFAGVTSAVELAGRVLEALSTVERHYAALFEREPELGLGGNLVFTGTTDDPATIATLAELGFSDPTAVAARIRGWHHGHIRATRSTRARELLTELLPTILDALRRQPRLDDAFRLFDDFLAGLPAGVQIFSLFRANPRLMGLLIDLVGAAPKLATHLARNVALFEAMLQPDFFDVLPEQATLDAELAARLGDAQDLEAVLDTVRRWAQGRQFQAGLHVLLGVCDFRAAAVGLTSIAEICLAVLLPEARRWLEAQHGPIAGGRFVILGLGKLGARELTIGSDLDLVLVYDAPEETASRGVRPLPPTTWFARLGQRLMSAVTARTAEGRLFEIDTRLRPSGQFGPVACSLASFEDYHERTAEIWEHQALCRARVVAGDADLAAEVETIVRRTIARPRDQAALASAVRAMRERMFKEHGSADPWNLKHTRGGLVDLEFGAQLLRLAHASRHAALHVTSTAGLYRAAAQVGLIEELTAQALIDALDLQLALQAVLRLAATTAFEPAAAPPGQALALIRAAARAAPDLPPAGSLQALEQRLVESQATARQFFDALCPPATAAQAPGSIPQR